MSSESLRLPEYYGFVEAIASLALHISVSELHGLLCGYLCAGVPHQGESYIRALLNNKKDEESRNALLALFSLYSISQQQITNYDLSFALLLPDEQEPLRDRAAAFREWCEGFTQGLNLAGIEIEYLNDEETQDAYQHIVEFAELDCESLDVDEEDEQALMEVTEYTRMAVIRLHGDIMLYEKEHGNSNTQH